jgi:FkbM family methyltransferase
VKRNYRLARWLGHQYWLRGRGHLASVLSPPDGHTGAEFTVPFFGHSYRGELDDFIDRHVYLFGGWELHILTLLRRLADASRALVRKPVTYVDVGANTGHHALFMSGHVDRVVCFEPFEGVRRRLEEKIASNRLDNVSVEPVALSARKGTSFYYPPVGRNRGTGSLFPDFSAANGTKPIVVRTDAGDHYFQDRSNPGIAILKIDVEGGERGVLEGLRNTLLRDRPAVILELSEYTRNDLGSLARLYRLLYPEAVAFTVERNAWRAGYKLHDCDFQPSSDILVVPSEFSAAVPPSASFSDVPAGPGHVSAVASFQMVSSPAEITSSVTAHHT